MSLLNDALRKKKKEEQKVVLNPAVFGGEPGPTGGRSIKLIVLVLLVLTLGGLFLLDAILSRPVPVAKTSRPATVAPTTLQPPPAVPQPVPVLSVPATPAQPATPIKQTSARKSRSTVPAIAASPASPAAAVAQVDEASPLTAPPASAPASAPTSIPGLAMTLPAPVKPFFDKAAALQREGMCGEAIGLYRSVLEQVPLHRESLFNLTECLIEQERFEEALPSASLLSQEIPGEPRAWLDLAVAEIGLAEYDSALGHLDKVDALGGYPFEAQLNRGVAHGRLGRLDEALSAYRSAERLNPADATLLFNLALTHDRAGQLPEAGRYYERYLKRADPAHPQRRRQVESRIATIRRFQSQPAAPQ